MSVIPYKKRISCVHMIGVGGAGMGGIAEVLLNQGYAITGSDLAENAVTERLQKLGAKIFIGHKAKHLKDADVVVTSSAIADTNPEVKAAHARHLPVMPRAQMLGELMWLQDGIAVAGTHGKTTTTSLIASIFTEAGLDPTFVIGGLLNSAGTNAKLGKGKYFIAEADESDASFLYLRPTMAVVTNIDADHMQTYNNNFKRLKKTFIDFLQQLPFYGLAVVGIDDPVVKAVLPTIARPLLTYGFSEDAKLRAVQFKQEGTKSKFKVCWKKEKYFSFTVSLPGIHNVRNALAAIAVALECDVPVPKIQAALRKFQGVGRRFQLYDNLKINDTTISLINDYGHHPKEIAVTVEAVRAAWPTRRLVLAFQPHRYSRTRDLFFDFGKVLAKADCLVLLEIYAASEKPIRGVSGSLLADSIKQGGTLEPIFVKQLNRLPDVLKNILQDDDILLMQGAGDIDKIAMELVANYLL